MRCLAFIIFWILPLGAVFGAGLEVDKWHPFTPREELRPIFSVNRNGGPDGLGSLVIRHDSRQGLDGAWSRAFPVEGATHYRITAYSKAHRVGNPRHHTYVELHFQDSAGRLVLNEHIGVHSRPFFARNVRSDEDGWAKFSDIFRAPVKATQAVVRLHLRWEPEAAIEWGKVSLVKSPPRVPRKVRLAAVNYRPQDGNSGLENCRQFASRIELASKQQADIVVLGECITSVGTGLSYMEAAESVPGPSTDYLAQLSDRHDLYLVTTLYERVGHLIYNTAVLLGPEGELVGKYRKICPARGEYRGGIAPGQEFPVFETEFGRIGLMICYDVHMPEVARGLAANGAEIITMPIMGGHPALARARAVENQVFLVTSTYDVNEDWMQTGVWDLNGELLVRAAKADTVVVAEVDLAEQNFFPRNMGDFKSRLRHERPSLILPK